MISKEWIEFDLSRLKRERTLLDRKLYHLLVRKKASEGTKDLYIYYNTKINKVTKEINKIEFKMSNLTTLLPKIEKERIRIKRLM